MATISPGSVGVDRGYADEAANSGEGDKEGDGEADTGGEDVGGGDSAAKIVSVGTSPP